ncbi:antirestriction protein [Scandinavium goeteborgense]|uniref:Antirestriction protein n=1 Tax=Scandinavium goeteborgense TaxID=1851514 RepID=A0A4R6DST9_SCAGO|nr:antirestriction protein [Scandinavium goeteborgense]TDN48083.1 antirestriction protein [Scandinavium goeteborgense]
MNNIDNEIKLESVEVSGVNIREFLLRFITINSLFLFQSYYVTYMSTLTGSGYVGKPKQFNITNGAFFIVPTTQDTYHVECSGNYYEGEMSAEATGITVTLFALNTVISILHEHQCDDYDELISLYYHLRNFVQEHPERSEIMRAID